MNFAFAQDSPKARPADIGILTLVLSGILEGDFAEATVSLGSGVCVAVAGDGRQCCGRDVYQEKEGVFHDCFIL